MLITIFRCLFLYAVRAAPQEPEEPIGKESLSAALTVSPVMMERSAMRLVRDKNTSTGVFSGKSGGSLHIS